MKRVSVILALLAVLSGARAEGPDDQYVLIYNLIQQADSLNNTGQPERASTKYVEAQTALQKFQKGYPDWNVKVVNFRLNYLATKLAAVSARGSAPRAPVPGSFPTQPAVAPGASLAQPAKPPPPTDWENQLRTLENQVRRLQEDKVSLEAKLKEALTAQPARSDPRELARAEERITGLLKENDLLKVSLAQEQAKPAPAADTQALEQAQQALAQAKRSLAEQTRKADALEKERTSLQNKLNNLPPSSWNAGAIESTRKALESANRKLAEQTKLASQLAQEKDAMQARLKALKADGEATAALRAENQLLKKQLADLKAAPPAAAKTGDERRQLARAQAQIAALQSDKEILRLEKIGLENRVKQLSAPAVVATVVSPLAKPEDANRIKKLQQERDDLRKQLGAATKELNGRKGKVAAARLVEMESQVATLRARLEVFEARQVPYTAEELALFRKPETTLARTDSPTGRTSVKELPPGTVALVAEAQRYFSARQLDRAEEKYLQVLRQDQNNVPTLANLAAIELELNHLAAAETNIQQAIALAPDDAFSLSILGHLRFRQAKYDQALDALSRAARIEPQNPQIQNYLGLALSEKGLRGPAETALRKAIQLAPGYGDAHNNLAVIYITQQPPLVELARWHYQKALAAGNPRNPQLEQMLEAKKAAEDKQP
jgi:Tfp pilus assembly protein PilF